MATTSCSSLPQLQTFGWIEGIYEWHYEGNSRAHSLVADVFIGYDDMPIL